MVKENKVKQFTSQIPQNIFSGFVVSLIALPLGLGLAIASGAPPISGIISAVIGGILVAILGGSHVTIAGPGNGLVIVILSAITTLGNGNMQEGFLYTLAAIVLSGVFMIILGFLRLGSLSNYFPSSAIQGMLAAIGIGILAKQCHVMLGNLHSSGSSIEQLMQIPNSFINLFKTSDKSVLASGIVGIISLLIMIFYSKIRNRYFQLIPAPMWIVLFSILLYYYYLYFSDTVFPFKKNQLINIPDDVFSNFTHPDFSKIYQIKFIGVVIAITLISTIESLLSIKAVDKLDPDKRRSNVNKDLKALGLATVISGFLGGLNVVIVIARSSINVNNRGTNRSANFFHAVFLALFIILFSGELRRIELSALAAILVYTGYKLASPENIKKIFKIGKEQLIIFLVTLITTLATSLITGILAGILATFIIHIVINKNILLFIMNVLKPNVLMYKETDKKNSYYVSVKNFSSFLNFSKLRSKLDQIPENEDVIVDFSMCDFVDHSIMENMHSYMELFSRKGGSFEVIGLDDHGAETAHPFAMRKLSFTKKDNNKNNLTKRQKSIKAIAKESNSSFDTSQDKSTIQLNDFGYFKTRKINAITNVVSKNSNTLFDIEFYEGELIAKQVIRATMFHTELNKKLPVFTLDREGVFEYIYHFTGFQEIIIKNSENFSKRYYLSGTNEENIQKLFTKELVHFFEENHFYHVESNGHGLLILGKERLASSKEIIALRDFGTQLEKIISKC